MATVFFTNSNFASSIAFTNFAFSHRGLRPSQSKRPTSSKIGQTIQHRIIMTKEESAKLLDKAAMICVAKHSGQRDKTGAAYFQHPMRVAMRCHCDEEKMVALLHDTIEDTDVTAEYLLDQGFPQFIIDGILAVTKRDGESYEDFVARAAQNPLGRIVKLHDLEDNLDVFRLDSISPEMAARFSKYLAAHDFLTHYQPINEPQNACTKWR